MGYFDTILAQVPAEDQSIINKYPALKAAADKLESDAAELSRYATGWVNWEKTNWDRDAGMTKEEKRLLDEKTALEAQLNSGSVTDAHELVKIRQEIADVKKAAAKEADDKIAGMNYFYGGYSSKILRHKEEFGENLDPQPLMKFMTENGIQDVNLAYDKMVAGKRAELATKHEQEVEAKHAADITAAEQRGRELAAQERTMGPNGQMPTDSTGGILGVTARMESPAKVSDDAKAAIAAAKPGTGELANIGYALYRQGAFTEK